MKSKISKIFSFLIILCICIVAWPLSASAKNKEFVVVIDAGHGGNDHGAVDNGVKEKDINLAVALKLGDLIKKNMKNTKVVYTRTNDSFVSLQGRADKANKAKGDLFISIHTNSVDAKSKARTTVEGASVYILGNGADSKNKDVVMRENLVIELEKDKKSYQGFDPNSDESHIMFEMAQKQDLSHSIAFAKLARNELIKTANRKDKGVHQAGFWVLWATSMPSVLVELDFICNPNSATYLKSELGKNQLAQSLFNAVKEYYKITDGGSGKLSADIDLSLENEESDGGETVLASRTAKSEKVHVDKSDRRQSSSSSRRRRSSKAARESEKAIQTVADIPVASTPKVEETVAAAAVEGVSANNSAVKQSTKKANKEKKNKKNAKNSSTHARIDKTLYDETVIEEEAIAEVTAPAPAGKKNDSKKARKPQADNEKSIASNESQDTMIAEAKPARRRNRSESSDSRKPKSEKTVAEVVTKDVAEEEVAAPKTDEQEPTATRKKSASRRKARIDHGTDVAQAVDSNEEYIATEKKASKGSNKKQKEQAADSSKNSEKVKTDNKKVSAEETAQAVKAEPKVPRLEKPVNSYYTVQLFSSQSKIKNNDIRLQGLNLEALKVVRHEGKYLYCYGESSDERSIERLKEQLRESYHDAEVLKIGSVK